MAEQGTDRTKLAERWKPGTSQRDLARDLGVSQQAISSRLAGTTRPSQSSYAKWMPWPVAKIHRNHYLFRWLLAYARSQAIEEGSLKTELPDRDRKQLAAVIAIMDEDDVILAGYDPAQPEPFWFEPRKEGEAGRYVRRPDGTAV